MDVRLNMEFDIFICLAWSSWISAVLGVKSRSIPYSLIFYDYVLVLFVLCVCAMCLFPYGSDGEFLQIINIKINTLLPIIWKIDFVKCICTTLV